MKTADQIANEHGCDITPAANGTVAITVQGYWQRGNPQDDARIRECRDAIHAAGLRLDEHIAGAAPTVSPGLPILAVSAK